MALPIIGAGKTPFAGTIKTPVGAGTTGSDIERRLAALESAFRVATDGTVTIDCKHLYIKAASSIEIYSASSMTFKGAQDVSIKGAQNVSLHSGCNLSFKGATINGEAASQLKFKGSTVDIEAPGQMSLKGATIRLN